MRLNRIVIPALSLAVWASAQWLDYRTPDIPRLTNGKPNLNAPAPRTPDGKPDFSGLWEPIGEANSSFAGATGRDPQFQDVAKEVKGGLPFQSWAAELLKARGRQYSIDVSEREC